MLMLPKLKKPTEKKQLNFILIKILETKRQKKISNKLQKPMKF